MKSKPNTIRIKGIALWATLAGVVVVASGLTYYYFVRNENKDSQGNKLLSQKGRTPPSGKFRCQSKSYPLTFATCHNDVKRLQQYLNRKFDAKLSEDGAFGLKTLNASNTFLGKTTFSITEIERLIS
ncbi:MAG: hypothetical protein WBA74_17470 [Cyclobacteriaceae bacterium]